MLEKYNILCLKKCLLIISSFLGLIGGCRPSPALTVTSLRVRPVVRLVATSPRRLTQLTVTVILKVDQKMTVSFLMTPILSRAVLVRIGPWAQVSRCHLTNIKWNSNKPFPSRRFTLLWEQTGSIWLPILPWPAHDQGSRPCMYTPFWSSYQSYLFIIDSSIFLACTDLL